MRMIVGRLLSKNPKPTSNMKMGQDLAIDWRRDRFLAHRMWVARVVGGEEFCVNDRWANANAARRAELAGTGCAAAGKIAARNMEFWPRRRKRATDVHHFPEVWS